MIPKLARALGIVGGLCGLFATAIIFVVPMYEGMTITVTSTGERIEEHYRRTLLQSQSLEPITIFYFTTMVALSLVATYASVSAYRDWDRGKALVVIGAGVLLLFGSFISGFSVGAYYLLGAVLVFISGVLSLFG